MNQKLLAWLFLVLGISLIVVSILFAIERTRYTGSGLPLNGNLGYGSIAAAIISAGCFVSSAILFKNKATA
jgi:hypothetical protein